MELDIEKQIKNAILDGIRDGVKSKLSEYHSPLEKLLTETLTTFNADFKTLLESSIRSCINDETFRNEIATAVRHQLAKTLIQRFGGEMEKQVNILKSDPTTRARITLAIEEIVKTQAN